MLAKWKKFDVVGKNIFLISSFSICNYSGAPVFRHKIGVFSAVETLFLT